MNTAEYDRCQRWNLIMADYDAIARIVGYVTRNVNRNDQADVQQDSLIILIGRLKSKDLQALSVSSIRWHTRRAAGTAIRNYIRSQRRNRTEPIPA